MHLNSPTVCGYKFRIPDQISEEVETDYAAETVEGGLFIWDGATRPRIAASHMTMV